MIVTTTINSFRAGHTDDFTWHTTKNGIPKINCLGKFVESNHWNTTTSQYTWKGACSVKNSNNRHAHNLGSKSVLIDR